MALGPMIVDMLKSPIVLGRLETRVAAGAAIAAVYPYISSSDRVDIEKAVLNIPDALRETDD